MSSDLKTNPSPPALYQQVIDTLKKIFDPEIPVNIYELGLIYSVEIDDQHRVKIQMTVTAPNCPVADSLPIQVREKVRSIEGITDAEVQVTFDPPWTPEKMSEAARLQLGFL